MGGRGGGGLGGGGRRGERGRGARAGGGGGCLAPCQALLPRACIIVAFEIDVGIFHDLCSMLHGFFLEMCIKCRHIWGNGGDVRFGEQGRGA